MSARCFVCGSADQLTEVAHNNWLCADCLPVDGHVVAMSNRDGKSVAECRCGWRSETAFANRATVQEAKVRLHWRDVIRRFDAEFGDGSAARELKAGAIAIGLLCVNLLGWLVVAGAAA